MKRCPHCATPSPTQPVCRICGLRLDLPATEAHAPDIERTSFGAAPAVAVAPAAELETTEAVLGDVRIPDEDGAAAAGEERLSTSSESRLSPPRPRTCPRCGAVAGASRLCDVCGLAMWPASKSSSRAAAEPRNASIRCQSCGSPNPAARALCLACGTRLLP